MSQKDEKLPKDEDYTIEEYKSYFYLMIIITVVIVSFSNIIGVIFVLSCGITVYRYINYYFVDESARKQILSRMSSIKENIHKIHRRIRQKNIIRLKVKKNYLLGLSMIKVKENEQRKQMEVMQKIQQEKQKIKEEIAMIEKEEKATLDKINCNLNQKLQEIIAMMGKHMNFKVKPIQNHKNIETIFNNISIIQKSLNPQLGFRNKQKLKENISNIQQLLLDILQRESYREKQIGWGINNEQFRQYYSVITGESQQYEKALRKIKQSIRKYSQTPQHTNDKRQQMDIKVFQINKKDLPEGNRQQNQQKKEEPTLQKFNRKQFMTNLDFLLVKGYNERQALLQEQQEKE